MLYVRSTLAGDPIVGLAIDLRPGTFVKMDQVTPNGYRLNIEDSFGRADMDFNDIRVVFKNNPADKRASDLGIPGTDANLTPDMLDA